jgi:hypothetical protein
MRRLLLVSEFASESDWHFQQLAPALASLPDPVELIPVRGVSMERSGGGLHPRRMFNGAAVYARLPWALLRHRPHAMICITTPPGIQVWCAIVGALGRTPAACWMMDYHPEIEARMLESRWVLRPLAGVLRLIDRATLRRFRLIIALDQAMAELCRQRAARVEVETFPPWPDGALATLEPPHTIESAGPLHLLHVGSLGRAHDLKGLERLARSLTCRCRVTLLGADPRTRAAFDALAGSTPIDLTVVGRLPGPDFARALTGCGAHFGLVVLKDRYAGLVSPSKFTAYVKAGIPLLSIGPPGTTAHFVCDQLGAGLHLPNHPRPPDLTAAAEQLESPQARARRRARVGDAQAWLARYDAAAFARLLDTVLLEGVGPVERA